MPGALRAEHEAGGEPGDDELLRGARRGEAHERSAAPASAQLATITSA